MSLSTYQKVYEKTEDQYVEKLTNYQEEGYQLKFAEYYIWRLTGSEVYSQLKLEEDESVLNLDFIENAIPEGEGEEKYFDPVHIITQMDILKNLVSKTTSKGINEEETKLLKNAVDDANRLIELCVFCNSNDFKISIGLDA